MNGLWSWLVGLSPHELDVLRTIAYVIGSAFLPILTFLLGWGIKLLRAVRRNAEDAAHQTRREDHIDGKLVKVSVADIAHRTAHDTQEFRGEFHSEISDLVNPIEVVPRTHGRRRLPTTDVPIPSHYIGEQP